MKRTLSWLLCGTMILGLLIGCGNNNDTQSSEGSSNDTIKIGYFGPLTGGSAQLGQAALNGAQLAVNQLNEKGGILGCQVEIVSYDDKSSPEEAVKAATKLVQVDKVNAIFGSLHSANVQAAAPVVEESQTLLVSGGTSPTWLQQGYTYLFRSIANANTASKQLAQYANDEGLKKIATFTSNDEYGTSGADAFKAACADYDIEFVAAETMANGDRDFTGQFAKINAASPDAVLVWCLSDDMGAVTKQLRQSGFSGTVLGPEGYSMPEILNVAGDTANGVCFAAQYLIYEDPEEAQDENMRVFLEDYIAEFGAAPASDNACRAYDGINMIAVAMEDSGADHGQELRDAYNDIDGYVGLAGTFSYKGGNGEGIDVMRIFRIEDGKYWEAE